jgi:predicted ester cyclase
MYRGAFPDGHTTVEDSIAEGDKVAYRWTFRGTHRGELMGILPTERQVTITGITVDRISGGKIEEEWNNFDQLGMLQQLGVAPAPGQ